MLYHHAHSFINPFLGKYENNSQLLEENTKLLQNVWNEGEF